MVKQLLKRIPLDRVNWATSSFLIGTMLIALTCVPWYIWNYGLDWFQVGLFFGFYTITGLSITLGYHRLFSHLSFKAKWPIKLFTLIFGAAAFENSVLNWVSDHRRHHKHVDHDGDPYDITKGFWYAHIGWILFKLNPEPPMDNVKDLQKDPLVMWQHRWQHLISGLVSFALPTALGWWYGGPQAALGAFLIGGIARVVAVQQSTFCINSLCHYIGKRPYSSKCSARDSWIAAIVSFGEGYHNFHHEFQHDYRNAVKPWQLDPTKWIVWTLEKVGLVSDIRRAPREKILLVEMVEAQRQINSKRETWSELSEWIAHVPESTRERVEECQQKLEELSTKFEEITEELQSATRDKLNVSRKAIKQWRKEIYDGLQTLEWILSKAPALK